MGNVQISAAIGESFRFVGEAWRRAWGIMLILVWFTAALQIVEALRPTWFAVPFLGLIVSIFVTTAAIGALYRLRLGADHPGDDAFAAHAGGLQWGALEWRVLGANLLVGVVIGVLAVVVFFAWALIIGFTVGGSPADAQAIERGSDAEKFAAFGRIMLGPAGFLTLVMIGPALVGLIYLSLRLALLAPLAADARSFDMAKAWSLARGAVLTLLVGSVVIFLFEVMIGAVFGGVAGLAAGVTGQIGKGSIWGGVAGQAVAAALNAPLFVGLVLYVYRTQRGDAAVAATFS